MKPYDPSGLHQSPIQPKGMAIVGAERTSSTRTKRPTQPPSTPLEAGDAPQELPADVVSAMAAVNAPKPADREAATLVQPVATRPFNVRRPCRTFKPQGRT